MAEQSRTVGIAIAIPEPWGEDLQEQRATYGDRQAWTIPTHITLLPPTRIAAGQLSEVDRHLRRVCEDVSPFELALGSAQTFRPVTPTVFLGLTEGSTDCERLEQKIRSGPLQRRLTYPYHPHVTLAMDVSDEVLDRAMTDYATFHAAFKVSTITRYELGEDGIWLPEKDFPLQLY